MAKLESAARTFIAFNETFNRSDVAEMNQLKREG
jgi:hypothetical protein